jgi:hypothetical protein
MTSLLKSMTLLSGFLALALVILPGCNSQQNIEQPVGWGLSHQLNDAGNGGACPTLPICSTIPEWQGVEVSRGWPENTAYYENGSVEHLTLYMADCFDSKGSRDGAYQFWGKHDQIAVVGSPLLFVGNIIKLPVDLVVTPPWEKQFSRSNYPLQPAEYIMPYETASGAEWITE